MAVIPDERSEMHDERPAMLVSACLLGTCCNHDGRHSRRPHVESLAQTHRLFPICPEVVGGLTAPRPAAEVRGGTGTDVLAGTARVVTVAGEDVTDAYLRGALATVELALAVGARAAVLKARSPSCGSSQIYDGTFADSLRDGEGVTAAALRARGIAVESEEDWERGALP